MEKIRLVLGEQEHEIEQIKTRAARKWRAAVEAFAGEIPKILHQAADSEQVDLTDFQAIAALLESAFGTILGAPDTMLDLLAAYSPELKKLLDQAWDQEVPAAFIEVVRHAYPFEQAILEIRKLLPGFRNLATGLSLPSPSGESGMTN